MPRVGKASLLCERKSRSFLPGCTLRSLPARHCTALSRLSSELAQDGSGEQAEELSCWSHHR